MHSSSEGSKVNAELTFPLLPLLADRIPDAPPLRKRHRDGQRETGAQGRDPRDREGRVGVRPRGDAGARAVRVLRRERASQGRRIDNDCIDNLTI